MFLFNKATRPLSFQEVNILLHLLEPLFFFFYQYINKDEDEQLLVIMIAILFSIGSSSLNCEQLLIIIIFAIVFSV